LAIDLIDRVLLYFRICDRVWARIHHVCGSGLPVDITFVWLHI